MKCLEFSGIRSLNFGASIALCNPTHAKTLDITKNLATDFYLDFKNQVFNSIHY
jgi:hypothetical protein